jgi:hypothetical protein
MEYITLQRKTGWSSLKEYSRWDEVVGLVEAQTKLPVVELDEIQDWEACFEIVQNAKLHLGVDSVFNHVAGAYKVPAVILFGSTDPVGSGHATAINLHVPTCGKACFIEDRYINGHRFTDKCPHGKCIDSIEPAQICAAVIKLLSRPVATALRPDFEMLWKEISSANLMGKDKTRRIYEELLKIQELPGELAEIGVYKGHTSKLMRMMFPKKVLHCYDTFCGIVGATADKDKHVDGEFSCSLSEVQKRVGTEGVAYHVGFFPKSFGESDSRFAFIHSDTDTYVGTKATLEIMFPLMVAGGIIAFDDYDWVNCPGVKVAIEEWLVANKDRCVTRAYINQFIVQKK